MATKISHANVSCDSENNRKERKESTTALDVSSSCLFALDGLDEFTYLKRLLAYDNCLSDIEGLQSHTFGKCENLVVLNLSFNQVQNIEFLQRLPSLRELYLSNNQVDSIIPVKDCKNVSLNFRRNEFPANGFRPIGEQNHGGNKLDSVTCIALACPSVEYLDLSQNLVRNIEEILTIVDYLKELKELNIQDNPLDFSETSCDFKSFMREIQGKVATGQRDQLLRSEKTEPEKKIFTLHDVGQEIVGAMEDQFTTLDALADIYNTRISERYERLKGAFSDIPAPNPWCTGMEVDADDELASREKHDHQNVRTRLYEALRFSRNSEEKMTETANSPQETVLGE
ncbi:hypothetical protein SprV_0301137600 [Sparganum proliferum]